VPALRRISHFVTSADSSTDAISVRLIHNFAGRRRPRTRRWWRKRRWGGRTSRTRKTTLNFGVNYARSSTNLVNPFPALAGGTSHTRSEWPVRMDLRNRQAHQQSTRNLQPQPRTTTNLFSGILDVAGNAGITAFHNRSVRLGNSRESVSVRSAALSDPTPRRELDQTYTLSDTVTWHHDCITCASAVTIGASLQDFRSAKNAEGSFIFTGICHRAWRRPSSQSRHGIRLRRFSVGAAATD